MLGLPSIRSGAGSATRRGFSLLAIVWLNLALTPCAVAFGGETGCAHNPTSGHHEMAGHHDHDGQETGHSCASLQEACCEIADVNAGSRSGAIEFDDSPEFGVLTSYLPDDASSRPLALYRATADPPVPPASSRAIHKLHCVYLN